MPSDATDDTAADRSLQVHNVAAWVKIITDIDGVEANDQSGISISLSKDGETVAIGSKFHDNSKGQVRVYDVRPATFTQIGPDIDGLSDGDEAAVVCLSSDGMRIAVGAPEANTVRLFDFLSVFGTELWAQKELFTGFPTGDKFGSSVALSADGLTVAVGAPMATSSSGVTEAGIVRAYRFVANAWTQIGGNIEGSSQGQKMGAEFALAISSDGNVLATGSPFHAIYRGRVSVYSYDPSGGWALRGPHLDGDSSLNQGLNGFSVALSADGNTVAAGVWDMSGGAPYDGYVNVHGYDADANTWNQLGSMINDEASGDQSGKVSLSDNGKTLAVGSPLNDNANGGTDSGHVRVYGLLSYINDTKYWSQVGQDLDGEGTEDESGYSISISGDGETVAVGAYKNDVTGIGTDVGHVRVYTHGGKAWGIDAIPGSYSVNATGDDDESGVVVTLTMVTGRGEDMLGNRKELRLMLGNCTSFIDEDEGQAGALIMSSSINATGETVWGYDMQLVTVEINTTVLQTHPAWVQGPTPATGSATICARTDLYHMGVDSTYGTPDDIHVTFLDVTFTLAVDLTNKAYSINAGTEGIEAVDFGSQEIGSEFNVTACFCNGGNANFTCDVEGTTILRQNGEVGICLYPDVYDTEIYQFRLEMDQENNTSPLVPVMTVDNDGFANLLPGPLVDVTKQGDIYKVTSMIYGVFFDWFDVPIPDIKINGTVDLMFKTVPSSRRGRRLLRNVPVNLDVSSLAGGNGRRDQMLQGQRGEGGSNIFEPANVGIVASSDRDVGGGMRAGEVQFDLRLPLERAEDSSGFGDGYRDGEALDAGVEKAFGDDGVHAEIHHDDHASDAPGPSLVGLLMTLVTTTALSLALHL